MLGRILSIEDADVQQTRDLAEKYSALSPRDLIHLAVMLRHELREIITADEGFDAAAEIRRIDPRSFS
jgi:predicted nucleic acid-binding protein